MKRQTNQKDTKPPTATNARVLFAFVVVLGLFLANSFFDFI